MIFGKDCRFMISPEEIFELKEKISADKPLVHCIVNPVAANDCANAVLAMGAKPVMAEHEGECAEITTASKALSINLGGINEGKMAAIEVSAQAAYENNIPIAADLVGVGCSRVRLEFAWKIMEKYRPAIVKGNLSEICAVCGLEHRAKGVDCDDETDIRAAAKSAVNGAKRFNTVFMITGKTDIITDGTHICAIENGNRLMSLVTGTGCVLGAVTGCFLSVTDPFFSAVSAAVTMGLAGEYAAAEYEKNRSISRFHGGMIDGLFSMDRNFFAGKARYKFYEQP